MDKEAIIRRYEKEINLTKMRIEFYLPRLNKEEINDLMNTTSPRNRAEEAIREDAVSFYRQLNLEGKSSNTCKEIVSTCMDEAIKRIKEIYLKR